MNKNNNQNNIKGYNINNIPLKKKRSKLIPIIASILGIVLLGGGFYFYNSYSKISKDDELYSPIIKKI